MFQNHSDEQLMMLFGNGNFDAFETLYNRHKGPVYRFFLRQISENTAEDLTQEVWSKLVHSRKKYRIESQFTTYLYTIARHCLIDHFRRQNVRPVTDNDNALENDVENIHETKHNEPDNCLATTRQQEALMHYIGQLPNEQREAFILKEESGLSLDTIGTITGTNKEAIKSRLRYAIQKLKHCLGHYLGAVETI